NIVNTLTYAAILILSLFAIRWALVKLRIKLDEKLFLDLLPFVFLGGVVRALVDAALLPHNPLFITPGIYLLIFAIAFSAIIAQSRLRLPLVRWSGFLLVLLAGSQAIANGRNWESFIMVLGLSAIAGLLAFFLFRAAKQKLFASFPNKITLWGHGLDASASFISITFLNFCEQHVVSSLFLGSQCGQGGTPSPFAWVFFPVKLGVVSLALYAIDKEAKGDWNWLLKFTLLVLGLGPGVRDATSVLINS
ncbi:DUF63 family protein, partial [Candidatus Micrarchaeota archaeon]|nr:DUF63 family protein [Candidatus Micrarchaeota archaeon]